MMRKKHIIIASCLLVLPAFPAFAAQDTGVLTVSANVPQNCRIKDVTDITFINYDATEETSPNDAAGDFTFKCTKGTSYDLYITGARTMTDGTDSLSYELYSDAGRTTAWPTVAGGVTGTSISNSDDTRGVYGRIPAGQDVGVGAYTGSVTVTVEF